MNDYLDSSNKAVLVFKFIIREKYLIFSSTFWLNIHF